MALALASIALAGCLGGPPAPSATAPAAAPVPVTGAAEMHWPGVPAALRPLLAAHEAGQAGGLLPLQGLVAHAEAFRGLPSAAVAPPAPGDMSAALREVLALDGVPVTPALADQLSALAAVLPRDLQDAIAVLARATVESSAMTREAFGATGGVVHHANADRVDWGLALRALRLKLAAVESALPVLQRHGDGLPALDVAGALPEPGLEVCGSLAVMVGREARTYACNYTLLVDLGGDDTYLGNAGGTHTIYASPLHVDVAGNDRYLSQAIDHTAVTGGAVSGVGTLVDVAGGDTYDTFAREGSGQNGGVQGGVGFLADLAGRDLVKATGMLHSGVNGAAWIGHGMLLLAGGDDTVEAWTEGAGALNGAGLLGTGLVVGLGGDRLYRATDGGQPFGGASNGAGVGGGLGTLLDHGGDTAYEAFMGGRSASANGGGRAGFGLLMDLGGGDDRYTARAAEGSALNGRGLDATGLLFDDGGRDVYDEAPDAEAEQDATVAPKGMGAQIDATAPTAPGAGAPSLGSAAGAAPGPEPGLALAPWPEAARPVARALLRAHEADFDTASLHGVAWALAALPGEEPPRDPILPARSVMPLPALVARFLQDHGVAPEALPHTDIAELARLPADLQGALAGLLAAYLTAAHLLRGMPLPAEGAREPPGAEALRARGLLLQAVEDARPVLDQYAGRAMASQPLQRCGVLSLDLTSRDATYTCDHLFQVTLGGGSTYRNNAGGSMHGGPAFLLDAAGDDRYEGITRRDGEAPVWYGVAGGGAGVTGFGFLADLAGDDLYAPACAEGCSAMGGADSGTGTLVDYAGDDHYMVDAGRYAAVTGGGIVGRGFLADLGGHDKYMVEGPQHTAAQGGAIFGTGFLFDREGDDLYHAATGEHGPVNGAAIIGAGLLLDLSGSDTYHAAAGHHAMVNGAGFWATPGAFLIDGAGDDAYTAVSGMEPHANGRYWYPGECPTQRTGCTRGVAALLDLGGSDAYLEWANPAMDMGHGHGGHDQHGGHGQEPPQAPSQEPEPAGPECAPPEGHEGHTSHEHACPEEGCAPPEGHEQHTYEHTCATGPQPPPPEHDKTEVPKGDSGAQLDLAGVAFARLFRTLAGVAG